MENSQGSYVGDAWKYDPNYQRTAEFLGINRYDREDADVYQKISHLDSLYEGKELPDKLRGFEEIRKKIGTQNQGKTLLNQLYQYSRLSPSEPKNFPKKSVQKKPAEKGIQGLINQAVQSSVQQMVKKAVGDKNLINKTVQNVLQGALK